MEPLKAAVTVTGVFSLTLVVWIVNVAELELGATVIEAGTPAAELFAERLTTSPAGPAFPVRKTVP